MVGDLAQLDAVAVDLDLVVLSSLEDQVAAGQEIAPVARSVESFPRTGDVAVDKMLSREFG
jgi:hypothetical protein